MSAPAVLAALQVALAAEHRAVFGYGLLGPRLPVAQRATAASCQAAHEQLRDATTAVIAGLGARPVPASADYPALYPVPDAAAARRLAAALEDSCAAAWRYAFAAAATPSPDATSRSRLASAQDALTASAVRATRWRLLSDPAAATTPFPGI